MTELMYRRIADDLRRRIEACELAPGPQLKTEVELGEEYDNASRNTVWNTIKLLVSRGLVETRAGQGTFVVEKIKPFVTTLSRCGAGETAAYLSEVEGSGRKPEMTTPRVEIQKAASVVADARRIKEGAHVISRHQERFIDGTPWSLQTTFYPHGARHAGCTPIDRGHQYLGGRTPIPHRGTRYHRGRTPRHDHGADAGQNRGRLLPPPRRWPGIGVLELRRTGYDEDGRPMRVTVTIFPADRNHLLYETGRIPPELAAPRPSASRDSSASGREASERGTPVSNRSG